MMHSFGEGWCRGNDMILPTKNATVALRHYLSRTNGPRITVLSWRRAMPRQSGDIAYLVKAGSACSAARLFPFLTMKFATSFLPMAIRRLAPGEADHAENDSENCAERDHSLHVHRRHPLSVDAARAWRSIAEAIITCCSQALYPAETPRKRPFISKTKPSAGSCRRLSKQTEAKRTSSG